MPFVSGYTTPTAAPPPEAYPPPEQLPPAEPVYQEPAPAPVQQQQAAPPQQMADPDLMPGPDGQVAQAPPPQEAAPAQQQAWDDPDLMPGPTGEVVRPAVQAATPASAPLPQDGGIVGAVKSTVQGVPENVSEFTGVGRNKDTNYQPAAEGVEGVNYDRDELVPAAKKISDASAKRVLSGDLGSLKDAAGDWVGVVGAHLQANAGDVTPERVNQINWTTERAFDEIDNGDAFASKQDADPLERGLYGAWYGQNEYVNAIKADPETYRRAMTEGYTDPNGVVYDAGPMASWQYYQDQNSGVGRFLNDMTMAPASAIVDAATGAAGGLGARLTSEAVEEGARLGTRQIGKELLGKALTTGTRAAEAGFSMGLSEAVPAALKVTRAGYNALPWAGRMTERAVQAEEASALGTAALSTLDEARTGRNAAGLPATDVVPSYVSNPGGAKDIVRVALPADGANPAVDMTYRVIPKSKGSAEQAIGIYDTALPGPTDRYRPVTQADAEQLTTLWQRLPNADQQKVRQAWFPQLSKLETSPGEPFIEHAAEQVYDRAGNLIADTGRSGSGYQRELSDLRSSILADGTAKNIVEDFTKSWEKTLVKDSDHPLTRVSNAAHRLQTLKDVEATLPTHLKSPELTARIRQMEGMLRKPAPGSIGTGLAASRAGGLVPVTAREQSWLRAMADLPTAEFDRKKLDGGRVGTPGPQVIFDRKPPASAPIEFHNGYTTYQEMMDHRVMNPPRQRAEIDSLIRELDGLKTAKPTVATQAREDAIRDVLERNKIVPGAANPAMVVDDVIIGANTFLKSTKPTFPDLPGVAKGVPSGVYTPGSQDELWGMSLEPGVRDQLDHIISINGEQKNAGQRLKEHWTDTATAAEIAKRQAAGVPLNRADQALLSTQLKKLKTRFKEEFKKVTETELATMPPEQIDRIAAALTVSDLQIAQELRSNTGKILTPMETKGLIGKSLAVYDGMVSKWRSMVLYNVGRGLTYPSMQLVGNLATVGIVMKTNVKKGGKGLLAAYVDPREWGKTWKYIKDVDTQLPPRAIEIRDRMGLGRTDRLGRISRDQQGSFTAFNGPDSHPMTKAVGKVLANQNIKDLGDVFDGRLRYAAYTSMMEPAYMRLKKDMIPVADQRIQRAAAEAGVPVALTRDQIRTAITQLEKDKGGYYTQTELRQAIFDAGGGHAAPNSSVLRNVADRIGRDYKEFTRKIDNAALDEADRIAFAGNETNLNQALNRGFMFTWWVGNASQLYLEEASRSPIQMYMWSRMLENADYQTQQGTDKRYRFYRDFMSTPAGYTLSMSPMGLLGGYLLGTTADPTDERAVLTKLGEITEGGWVGDNLVLSPAIKASLFAIGALGRDARTPDVLGVGSIERSIVDGLNAANQHLIQFNSTKGGNPERVAYPGVSQGVLNRIAQLISGKLPGTQPVAGFDPNAAPESQISYQVARYMEEQNPELDPMDPADADILRQGVDQAMANHDSPLYQQALSDYVDGLYASPASGSGNAALDVVGGIARRYLSPLPITAQPTYRIERNERRNRDKLREDGSTVLDPDVKEGTELDKKTGTLGSRTPEGRELALIEDKAASDPQTAATKKLSDAIQYSPVAKLKTSFDEAGITSLRIDGYEFTAEQIASLPAEDRQALKNRWIDATPGGRQRINAYYDTRNEQLKSDKAFGDAEGLSKYAEQYPGGVDRFVDETANVNPNYEKFINGYAYLAGEQVYLPDLRTTDHEAWTQVVTQFDQARSVIAGVKDSRYGIDIDPHYAGVVGGLDGETVGSWLIKQNEADAAQEDSDYTAEMRTTYDKFIPVAKALDKYDTQVGNAPGTSRALFTQNVINGALDNADDYSFALPKATHDWLKTQNVSDYFESSTSLKNLLAWQIAQPRGSDVSIDAYQQGYWAEKNKGQVAEIAQRLATGEVPPLDAQGNPQMAPPFDPLSGLALDGNGAVGLGNRPGLSTLAAPGVIAAEPGSGQGYNVPAGMPLQTTGEVMNGSDGSVWMFVMSGGGISGWVNQSQLAPMP